MLIIHLKLAGEKSGMGGAVQMDEFKDGVQGRP
jgi:hypothetical protein